MKTNNMENSRGKGRKSKSNWKQKEKSNTDSVGEIDEETELISPNDRGRPSGHLATTVTLVGNIVDMQGSLDQGGVEKGREEERTDKKDTRDGIEASEGTKHDDECEKGEATEKDSKDSENSVDSVERKESNGETVLAAEDEEAEEQEQEQVLEGEGLEEVEVVSEGTASLVKGAKNTGIAEMEEDCESRRIDTSKGEKEGTCSYRLRIDCVSVAFQLKSNTFVVATFS